MEQQHCVGDITDDSNTDSWVGSSSGVQCILWSLRGLGECNVAVTSKKKKLAASSIPAALLP